MFDPRESPLTGQWLDDGTDSTPEPLSTLHVPWPRAGTTASSVPEPLQELLDGPPSADRLLLVTYTSELLLQLPLLTVHVNLLLPDDRPKTEVLAEDGETTDAVPTLVQTPVPIDGTVALRTADELQTLWLDPAEDTDGMLFVTFTSENEVHAPRMTVHLNTLSPVPRLDRRTL